MNIVGRVRWSQRKKLVRLARKSREPHIVRRTLAIAQLARGRTVAQAAEAVCAARSSVYLWARWFRTDGVTPLQAERRSSERRTLTDTMMEALEALLATTPQVFGYLHIPDPRKAVRLCPIKQALACRQPGVEVFYHNEADLDLNPRIGPAWRRRGAGSQNVIPTPGQNRKAYIAGALHAHTGSVVWVGGLRKDSA